MNRIQIARTLCLGLALSLAALTGCDVPWTGILGSGVVESENRDAADFTQIEVAGIGSVYIEFGETPSVRVTCDDNLLEYIKTDVADGALTIWQTESIRPSKELRVDVVMKSLSSAEISGAGKMNVQAAQLENLNVGISGSGNFYANGTAENLDIEISGAAKIDADELRAKSVKISISGAAKADIYASQSLDASVSGTGKIHCLGSPPDVKQSVSGVGRIDFEQLEAENGE